MSKRPSEHGRPFASEKELCARFLGALDKGWTPYAETAGWDILLVRDADGFQIGVEAKLKLNVEVINQAIEDNGRWGNHTGPDCRAVLVPTDHGKFSTIADYIGLTIIRVALPDARYTPIFHPYLPRLDHQWDDWHEWCPLKRHPLPEYVPDVAAGSSAPIQLTTWKIAAIKIAVTLERRGYVTRADFKCHGIDHRRWAASESGWLSVRDGRFVAGSRLPDFKTQHPIVYAQIEADAEKWMPAPALVPHQHTLVGL